MTIFPGAVARQLVEWGYPKGVEREAPRPNEGFSVVHITGNHRLPSADGEITWRQTDPADQNSATFFVNRDGSIRQALSDPLHMAPWSNGDVQNPDLRNARIAACVRAGVNPNLRTIVSIENVGYEPGHPITPEQVTSNARIIAHYHRAAGAPVDRETVIGHYQINGKDRPNCPGVDKSVLDRIVAEAQQIYGGELPDTAVEGPDMYEWVRTMTHQVPKPAIARAGTVPLANPDGTEHSEGFRFVGGERLEIIGGLPGWLWAARREGGNGLFLVPNAGIQFVKQPAPVTEKDIEAAVAAFNKNLDVWAASRPRR